MAHPYNSNGVQRDPVTTWKTRATRVLRFWIGQGGITPKQADKIIRRGYVRRFGPI